MSTARVQVFEGSGRPFVLQQVPLPLTLGPGDVLVKISMATICGSDLHTVDGRRSAPTPCVLGHEAVGTVVESNRPGIPVGQRVTWTLADSCGRCSSCVEWELPQKCDQLFKYGHASLSDGFGLNGCYASHIVLRPGTTIVTLPATLSDSVAVPANCALATVIHALRELPRRCERVLIQGSGLLGVYAAAWLKSLGITEILCVDADPNRLAWIEHFGGQPYDSNRDMAPVDLVLEVAGSAEIVADGLNALRVGGHYVWAGMVHPQTVLGITGESIVKKCATVRGVHNYTPDDLREGVEFLAKVHEQYDFSRLVSPPVPLAQLDEAFDLARQRRWLRVAVAP